MTLEDVAYADSKGYKIKLLGRAIRQPEEKVCAFVAPKLIGGAAALPPVGGAGSSLVETGWQLTEVEMEKLGSDVLITGLVPELDKQELPKEAE